MECSFSKIVYPLWDSVFSVVSFADEGVNNE